MSRPRATFSARWREIDDEMDDALRRILVAGRAEFEDELRNDGRLWSDCDAQWGLGSGYRDGIASKSRQ